MSGSIAPVVPEEREVVSLSPYDRQLLSDIRVAAAAAQGSTNWASKSYQDEGLDKADSDLLGSVTFGTQDEMRAAQQRLLALREDKVKADILARFERRNLAPETIKAIENSTSVFRSTAKYILEVTKPGREQSAALTALEEAKMWTNQSLALNGADA